MSTSASHVPGRCHGSGVEQPSTRGHLYREREAGEGPRAAGTSRVTEEKKEGKERNPIGSHLDRLLDTVHWPLAIFLKQQAQKHREGAKLEKSEVILLSRGDGQESKQLIGAHPTLLPGTWGRH